MDSILNLVIAADSKYLPYAVICLKSLFITNNDFKQINVHLLANKLKKEDIANFSTVFLHTNNKLFTYSISDIEDRLCTKVPSTISITSYARLFICSILPLDVDKVLYVDCDVIFNGSIFDLYNTDIRENMVGGVLDTFMNNKAKLLINIPFDEPYLNAGVLLIPLSKWRKQNMEEKFIKFLLENKGNVYHHDQGIINAVCCGKKMIFEPKFNASSFYFSHPYRVLRKRNTPFYSKKQVNNAKEKPVIIHFTCGYLNRPWIKNCYHPYKKLFDFYKQMTIYNKIALLEDKRSNREKLDSFIFRNFPFSLFVVYSKIIDFIGGLKK